MGNWSPAIAERRAEAANALRERSAERDRLHPPMERPCGTPGAVYTITVDGNDLGCVVHLPFSIEGSMPPEAKEDMKKALHDAVLPIVETFYRKVWKDTIAGKVIDGDSEPMPKRWELLFTKWLKRSFAREDRVVIDGSTMWSEDSLPTAYRWWV